MATPAETLPTLSDADIEAYIMAGRKTFPADSKDTKRISKQSIPLEERSMLLAYVLRYMPKDKATGLDINITSNFEENPLDATVQRYIDRLKAPPARVIGVSITYQNKINAGRVSDFAGDLTKLAREWGADNLGMPRYDELNNPATQEGNRADKSFTLNLALGFSEQDLPLPDMTMTSIPASIPASVDAEV